MCHNFSMDEVVSSIISICLIFVGTVLGSSFVFLFRNTFSKKCETIVLGFASGIMISAAVFGLIIPSIEETKNNSIYDNWEFVPILIGFIIGCLVLFLFDKLIPHIHLNSNNEEGIKNTKISKQTKFFLAVSMHNIPEGLAVGFAAGLALNNKTPASIMAVFTLALGIAIQNIPEGAAVSIPYLGLGKSKQKAFLLGSLSGVVEPIFAIVGLFISFNLSSIMPWLLCFAAGMMIYVTLEEILPDTISGEYSHFGTWSFIIGFSIMMVLEMIL